MDIVQIEPIETKYIVFDESLFPAQRDSDRSIASRNEMRSSKEDEGSSLTTDMGDQLTVERTDPDSVIFADDWNDRQEGITVLEDMDEVNCEQPHRYLQRHRTSPDRYVLTTRKWAQVDSLTVEEAFDSAERAEWEAEIKEEMNDFGKYRDMGSGWPTSW